MRTKIPPRRLELLRRVPLFRGLSDAEITRIDQLVDEIDRAPGAVLTRQGQVGAEAFVIVSGTAAVTIDGSEVAMLGPGDMVGEMALVDPAPRNATVTVRTPMVALVVDRRGFGAVLREAGVRQHLLEMVVRRLRAVEASS
jgi:CRP/FNR family cyclic AMP-dependent transcriptional regulator